MIKRLLLATFVTVIIASFALPVYAQQPFYTNRSDNWIIVGVPSIGEKNAFCGAEYTFKDGSSFTLYSDLIDGELYFSIHNVRWNISDPPQTKAVLRVNFHGGGTIKGGTAEFIILNKNTITVPNINGKNFLPDFMDMNKIELIMPGTIENAAIPLTGSRRATEFLAECVASAGRQEAPKVKKKGIDL